MNDLISMSDLVALAGDELITDSRKVSCRRCRAFWIGSIPSRGLHWMRRQQMTA